MKFLKHHALLIAILLLAGIVIGCENADVKTDDPLLMLSNSPAEGIAEDEISKESKQEILAENVEAQKSARQKNSAPTILVTEPDSNDIFTGNILEIWWQAEDSNDDKLLIMLEYQKEGSWFLIADNVINDRSLLWDLGTLSNGGYNIRATVTDGALSASDSKAFEIKR